ncbi:G-protein coupled receptor 20 [Monodelphis domestica]|nr:G-protein coupled receptor 20 [Monodelphis domestica]
MPSSSPQESSLPPASANATAPANSSMEEKQFFYAFSLLDKELHDTFPNLWVALLAVNGTIFLVGVALNGLALYVFCFRTKTKTTSIIYTINLVVTDLLVGLSLPTRFIIYYGAQGCLNCSLVHVFSYFVNMYCSILFLTCICVDRYLAIVQLEASRKWRNPSCTKGICVFIWVFAVVVTFSVLTVAVQGGSCCRLFALTVFEYFLPLVVITFFTGRIMCALSKPNLMHQSRERRMRAVQLLLTVLVIFLICFTPFHARQLAVSLRPQDISKEAGLVAYHVTITLSSLNSCMDPIVYCFVTNSFQATVRGLFRRSEPEQISGEVISMHKSSKGSIHNAIVPCSRALADRPQV